MLIARVGVKKLPLQSVERYVERVLGKTTKRLFASLSPSGHTPTDPISRLGAEAMTAAVAHVKISVASVPHAAPSAPYFGISRK